MSESAAADTLEREVAAERLTLLCSNVRAANLPTLLVGALYAAFYTHFERLPETWLWFAALTVLLGWRAWLLRGGRRVSREVLHASLLATGIAWGAAPLIVMWQVDDFAAFAALLLSGGIAVAGFGSYGVDTRAAAAVTLPIGAAVLAVAVLGGNPAYYALAVALPLLYAHQFFVAARARSVLDTQIRLRLENTLLVEELSRNAERTNAELERRLETERVLRASRDRAERLKQEVSRAFRERTRLSLVICDIDYFKQFNDLYGHQRGDECLKSFARVLEKYCRRGGDLAARIGGEEFALLLPTTDHAAARSLAEQTRAAFDALDIPHAGSRVKGNTTASFGVASVMPDNLEAGEALIRHADRALYAAKERGRNRVVSETEIAGDAAATA